MMVHVSREQILALLFEIKERRETRPEQAIPSDKGYETAERSSPFSSYADPERCSNCGHQKHDSVCKTASIGQNGMEFCGCQYF